MKMRWLCLGLGALGLVASTAQAEGDASAGQNKAVTCVACHGQDGNSVNPEWPKLAGQHEQYLLRQMQLFKGGERDNPIMFGMVATLTEQDMADLSAFYASQSIQAGVADETLVRDGERLYRAGDAQLGVPACAACHGPTGRGNPETGYPAIGGQHTQYVANALKAFREGAVWGKGDRANVIMSGVAQRLTDAEIVAVSSYIEGLH
jgi:cytochrome c553